MFVSNYMLNLSIATMYSTCALGVMSILVLSLRMGVCVARRANFDSVQFSGRCAQFLFCVSLLDSKAFLRRGIVFSVRRCWSVFCFAVRLRFRLSHVIIYPVTTRNQFTSNLHRLYSARTVVILLGNRFTSHVAQT